MNDLKFSFRQLLQNPGFTAVAVLTLALGIGATSAVFSLIKGVLLTPPPYPNPEQVVLISPVRIDRQPYVRRREATRRDCQRGDEEHSRVAPRDPRAVASVDAAAKLSILAYRAFGAWLPPDTLPVRGIGELSPADCDLAEAMGFRIRLVARAERVPEGLTAAVEPVLLPDWHLLASVEEGEHRTCPE